MSKEVIQSQLTSTKRRGREATDLRSDDSVFVSLPKHEHYRLRYRSATVRAVRDAELLSARV